MKTDVTKDGKHNGGTKISEIREFVKLFHEQLNEFIKDAIANVFLICLFDKIKDVKKM